MSHSEKRFLSNLSRLITERKLSFSDLTVTLDLPTEERVVTARCTSDPLFQPPPSVGQADGPWNHRRLVVAVQRTTSEETDRDVYSTTATYAVAASHANYSPLPTKEEEIRIAFNWEFDAEDLSVGVAELRDGDRLHYVSVRPPETVCNFVAAVAEAERIVGRAM